MTNTNAWSGQPVLGKTLIHHSRGAGILFLIMAAFELIYQIVNVLSVAWTQAFNIMLWLNIAGYALVGIALVGKKKLLLPIGFGVLLLKSLMASVWLPKLLILPAWLLAVGISTACLTDGLQKMKNGLSKLWFLPALLYGVGVLLEVYWVGIRMGTGDSSFILYCGVRLILVMLATFLAMFRLTHPDSEEAKRLRLAEEMYRHGDLTFAEYDALKAKYTGTQSFAQQYGLGFTMAVSDKLAADKAVEQHRQDAQKRIITNSAIGNAVGGLAGGVAAAVSTANRVNAEGAQLLSEQEKANQRYEEALKKSIK